MGMIRDIANGFLQAITPPQFANDKDFATTEFVQRALGNFQSHTAYMSNQTLAEADMGRSIQVGYANISLPPCASVPAGSSVKLLVTGGGVLSVSGGATFVVGGLNGNVVTAWQMVEGDEAVCVNDGGNWLVFGTMSLKQSSKFGASLAANGYQKLPSGLIIQWGTHYMVAQDGNSGTLNTFPLAFPNACVRVVAADYGSSGSGSGCYSFGFGNLTATNMRVWARNPAAAYANGGGSYIAIGY